MGKYINVTLNNIYKKNDFAERFKILVGCRSEK